MREAGKSRLPALALVAALAAGCSRGSATATGSGADGAATPDASPPDASAADGLSSGDAVSSADAPPWASDGGPVDGGEAGAGYAGGPDGVAPCARPLPYHGAVPAEVAPASSGPNETHSIWAAFESGPGCLPALPTAGCIYLAPGVSRAPPGPADAGVPPTAGDITVESGATVLATVTVSNPGYYGDVFTATWMPGDTLSFSAAGDPAGVHAFAGSIAQGTQIQTTPHINTSNLIGVTVPLSGDGGGWELSWTPDSMAGELVDVHIDGPVLDSGVQGGSVWCQSIPDSDGKVIVPYALLQMLHSGDLGGITVYRTGYAVVTADNAYVRLESISRLLSGALFR